MNNQVSGIYCIKNTVNNKLYIGSSKDIGHRFKRHISKLKLNKHANNHLQSAVNKYNITSFTFIIIETCNIENLQEREQYHIDSYNWHQLYNKARLVKGVNTDSSKIPVYLLNLKGQILKKYISGSDLARDLKLSIAPYSSINTKTISKKKYRIVTEKFYHNNLSTILSWNPYSCLIKEKSRIHNLLKYQTIKNGVKTLHQTKSDVANITGLSTQRISQIFKMIDNREINEYYHKKSEQSVQYVKNFL